MRTTITRRAFLGLERQGQVETPKVIAPVSRRPKPISEVVENGMLVRTYDGGQVFKHSITPPTQARRLVMQYGAAATVILPFLQRFLPQLYNYYQNQARCILEMVKVMP